MSFFTVLFEGGKNKNTTYVILKGFLCLLVMFDTYGCRTYFTFDTFIWIFKLFYPIEYVFIGMLLVNIYVCIRYFVCMYVLAYL